MVNTTIAQMIDATGRLRYAAIREFAQKQDRAAFEKHFTHPLLVSAALCEGDIGERPDKGATMVFNLSDISNAPSAKPAGESEEAGEIQRSIYPLIKEPASEAETVIYTIGRIPGNDFMLVDYTISRQHARIEVAMLRRYTIMDCGSLNGTAVNEQPLTPHQPVPLAAGNKIRFGRFQFFFLAPTLLYVLLRQSK